MGKGKAEPGSTRWVANKMKANGLQRLRWYCQMCEKQCRDENGFKCHRMSESHQRMMKVYMQTPGKFMSDFSREFESTFMRLMRGRYRKTKVLANTVYCEVIADKQHIHMNATQWTTLHEFVHYLHTCGKVRIEETEKGTMIQFIDRERMQYEKEQNALIRRQQSADERHEQHMLQLVANQHIEEEVPPDEVDGDRMAVTFELKKPEVASPSKKGSNIFKMAAKKKSVKH